MQESHSRRSPQPMETLFSILMGLGLPAACGFRVFVPLLVAGIGIHAGPPSLNSQHSTLNLLPLPSAPSHPNTRIQIPATPDLGPPPGPGSGIHRLRPGKHLLVVQMQHGDGAVLSRVEVDIGPSTAAIPEARPERVMVPVLEPAVQAR